MARKKAPPPKVWPDGATVYTVGHSTLPIEDFAALLAAYGIETVVDIRTVPRSRRNPQFNADALPQALKAHGIEYVGHAGPGRLAQDVEGLAQQGLAQRQLSRLCRLYANAGLHRRALDELIDISRHKRAAIMCAEAVPWRCHRSLVADALEVRGIPAVEILSPTSSRLHKLTPFAHVDGTTSPIRLWTIRPRKGFWRENDMKDISRRQALTLGSGALVLPPAARADAPGRPVR